MPATITDILRDAVGSELVTVKALEAAAQQGDNFGYRCLGGQPPKLLAFRAMVSRTSRLPASLKRAMLDWLVDGTGYAVVEAVAPSPRDLDANGNGRLDDGDAVIHSTRAACGQLDSARVLAEEGDYAAALKQAKAAQQSSGLLIATLTHLSAGGGSRMRAG